MTETWRGLFTYDLDTGAEADKAMPVPFILEWQEDDGIITGICTDDESRHLFNEPAKISGFIENNFISLIKKYPCFLGEDEAGNVVAVEDLHSQEIHYSGYYYGDHYEGVWELSREEIVEGSPRGVEFSGTWEMYKAV